MQTGIAVHDTDQEQGNVMNSNPNHGGSRKENVITKATLVAVLVALGLAMTAEYEVSPRQVVAASAGDGRGGQG